MGGSVLKKKEKSADKIVLICVVKSKRDREILFRERWYRIPAVRMPVRRFDYLAFYEPAVFGRKGKRIRSFARVRGNEVALRRELFPGEARHPRANEPYMKFLLGRMRALPHPIKNRRSPRRITFGFATLARLKRARTVLQLFSVPPTEEIMARALKRAGIRAIPQYRVAEGKRRFRLDFAVLSSYGGVAIECDNKKAHAGKAAHRRDAAKDAFLAERGWKVLHFSDLVIQYFLPECMKKITRAVRTKKTRR